MGELVTYHVLDAGPRTLPHLCLVSETSRLTGRRATASRRRPAASAGASMITCSCLSARTRRSLTLGGINFCESAAMTRSAKLDNLRVYGRRVPVFRVRLQEDEWDHGQLRRHEDRFCREWACGIRSNAVFLTRRRCADFWPQDEEGVRPLEYRERGGLGGSRAETVQQIPSEPRTAYFEHICTNKMCRLKKRPASITLSRSSSYLIISGP